MLGFFLLCVYTMVMWLGMGTLSLIGLVLMMELLSWLFVGLAEKISLKYLLIQSLFVMVGLAGLMWASGLIVLALVLKLGVPPVHTWIIHAFCFLASTIFIFMMSLHKLIPILMMVKLGSSVSFLLGISVFFGSILFLPQMAFLLGILGVSSMTHSIWLFFGGLLSSGVFFIYMVFYSGLLLSLLLALPLGESSQASALSQGAVTSVGWLSLSGLPPFSLFWLKLSILTVVLKASAILVWLLVGSLVGVVLAYFRVFCLSLVSYESFSVLFPLIVVASLFIL